MKEDAARFLPWLIAGGVILAFHLVVLALVLTPAPHSGGDNTGYLTLARALVGGAGYTEMWDPLHPPHAKYPPAYPLLLAFFMLLGASTWTTFKFVSAGLVAASVLFVFAWASRRGGLLFGAGVAIATLLSAGWIQASRWVLSEPLFLVGVFVALWSADRARLRLPGVGRWAKPRSGASSPPSPSPPNGTERGDRRWIVLAAAFALVALFTRTAGLPLLIGLLVLLAAGGRRRAAAGIFAVVFLPILLWILRGRSAGEGAYQEEFWLRNPYDPGLGTIGVGDLAARTMTNIEVYVGRVLGEEWWGGFDLPGGALAAIGVLLVSLALIGWGRRVARGEGGLAELFLPLYGGLVLLWPEVWSGDRFVLPLYPLLLAWAGEALAWIGRFASPIRRLHPVALPALLFVVIALSALPGAWDQARVASHCRDIGREDPFACYGAAFQNFREAAAWSGEHLPPDAVVINRRPRVFYLLGGPPGRVFPFHTEADSLLVLADRIDARYLVVDEMDMISVSYLPAIIRSRPAAFCWIRSWGEETALLGIVPPEARSDPAGDETDPDREVLLPVCGPAFPGSDAAAALEGTEGRDWIPFIGHRVPVIDRDVSAELSRRRR